MVGSPSMVRPSSVVELERLLADRSAKISFLQEMTGALAAADSLGELLDRTAEIAQEHLPYEVCSTHLVDPESGRITVVLGSGPLFETISTTSLKVGEGVVGWVVENGRIANVADVRKDSRYIASSSRILSELAVPIPLRGRTVGVFNLESTAVGAFTAYDEQIFSILAAQIGASMERVDLYREALERARRLATLNQIARAIADPTTLDRIFDVVADELARRIPNDRTSLALYLPESSEMQIVGVRGLIGGLGPGTRFTTSLPLSKMEGPTYFGLADADVAIRPRLEEVGIANWVAVPIRLDGEFVAQLTLAWQGPMRLNEGGEEFLGALASHLAVVLKNARLHDKLTLSDEALVRTQGRLIQSSKLAAVGELAAGVAHELNNPLTGILGYTQWILHEWIRLTQEERTAESLEAMRVRLQKIEREGLRCKEIVQNLLNFSRSQDPTASEPIDLNAIVEATLSVTEHQLHLTNVRVVKELRPGLPPIEGNANQLQQVFTNIVINAAKAMPGGGRLAIATDCSSDRRRVHVAFEDTGLGMPRSVQERIFEPFFTTRKVGEGTGLGLSVSYGIVKAHRGEITVASKEGEGSTFTVTFPAIAQQNRA